MAVSYPTTCIYNPDALPVPDSLQAESDNPLGTAAPQVMRLGIALQPGFSNTPPNGTACVTWAAAHRYKVYLTVEYSNDWTPATAAGQVATELPLYQQAAINGQRTSGLAQTGLWAVSIGNEQDVSTGHGAAPSGDYPICKPVKRLQGGRIATTSICHPSTIGDDYRLVWNAVEPVVKALAPRAIVVYADVSPWSFGSFIRDGWSDFTTTPPGVGAIGAHCYVTLNANNQDDGGLGYVPALAAWAATKHVPVWCSEMGPYVIEAGDQWYDDGGWPADVANAIAASPDLQMVSFYDAM